MGYLDEITHVRINSKGVYNHKFASRLADYMRLRSENKTTQAACASVYQVIESARLSYNVGITRDFSPR